MWLVVTIVKTKELMIGPVLKDPPQSVSLSGTPRGTRHSFQTAESACQWSHVDAITSKAAKRLHFLKQLKRSGAARNDLLCFYGTVIRPVLHWTIRLPGLALKSRYAAQTKALESLQRLLSMKTATTRCH